VDGVCGRDFMRNVPAEGGASRRDVFTSGNHQTMKPSDDEAVKR
jgi:hypothetical protein